MIIHLDDGTPMVYTWREVKAGTELAMFYGADYPLPPSPPPADAADPDEPAAEGSNQPVLTTQNILFSASALPAGQLYADDGSWWVASIFFEGDLPQPGHHDPC